MRLSAQCRYTLARLLVAPVAAGLLALAGCGYHTLGAATHLPPDVKTLSVPLFATRTESYHSEVAMTNAVIREFAARTRLRVTPAAAPDADAILHGTILRETVAPRSSRRAFSSPLWRRLRSTGLTAESSTRTTTTCIASSTNPPRTYRFLSRKIRRRWIGFQGPLRGNLWPM